MKTIFVQIKCEPGKAYQVADQIVENVEGVSEVHSTSGQYDLLVKCCLGEGDDIGHFVTERMQTVPGVRDTFTVIAFKAFT
ncbi:MAG: Lrp/AsnC ligand binding domain-containing protein [Pseudomonadota bacterium]